MQALLVVEGSGKVPALQSMLRSMGHDITVLPTLGHVGCNPSALRPLCIDGDFKETAYTWSPERVEILKRIEAQARISPAILLGMDDDQEGDVIAADVARYLEAVPAAKFRMRLRAVTEPELAAALAGIVPMSSMPIAHHNGVCRRILDRAIGGTFTEIDKPDGAVVGRVLSSTLLTAVEAPIATGEFVVKAKLSDGEYLAHIPVYGANDLERLIAFQDQILHSPEKCELQNFQTGVRRGSSPFGFEGVILEVSRKLGVGIMDAERIMQRAYETGLMSYPRTRANGITPQGARLIDDIAQYTRCMGVDVSMLEMRDERTLRYPHETPRPMTDDVQLGKKLSLLSSEEALAVLVTRNWIESAQMWKVASCSIASQDLQCAGHFEMLRDRPKVPWKRAEPEPGFQAYTREQAMLTYLASHSLGRPSTVVGHALRMLGRELFDSDMKLNVKGLKWADHAHKSGLRAETSLRIEQALEGDIEDASWTAREILANNGLLGAVEGQIMTELLMMERQYKEAAEEADLPAP